MLKLLNVDKSYNKKNKEINALKNITYNSFIFKSTIYK